MSNLAETLGNICKTDAGLAIGTNTGTIKTTATLTFTVNGVFYAKSATDNISIAYTAPDDTYNTVDNGSFTGGTNGSTRLYGCFINSAGTVSVVPGPIVDSVALAAGTVALEFPPAQKDKACFGAIKVALTAGTSFVPGTTGLDASGVTETYYDLAHVPFEPLRS